MHLGASSQFESSQAKWNRRWKQLREEEKVERKQDKTRIKDEEGRTRTRSRVEQKSARQHGPKKMIEEGIGQDRIE